VLHTVIFPVADRGTAETTPESIGDLLDDHVSTIMQPTILHSTIIALLN
jgi:hypothetical protein